MVTYQAFELFEQDSNQQDNTEKYSYNKKLFVSYLHNISLDNILLVI